MEALQTVVNTRLESWQVVGDDLDLLNRGREIRVSGYELPTFLARANRAYSDLAKTGTKELPTELVGWLLQNMTEDTSLQRLNNMHPAFHEVFPIPSFQETVTPLFKPWIEISTDWETQKSVVIQPMVLTPVAVPSTFDLVNIDSRLRVKPQPILREDPFCMATLTKGEGRLTIGERGHLRALIRAYWQSITEAHEETAKIEIGTLQNRGSSANKALFMMEKAAASLSSVAQRVVMCVWAQEGSPLSLFSRTVIQLPWLIKASEAWMKPVRTLASAGRLELPEII